MKRGSRTAKTENAGEPAAKKPAKTGPAKTDFSALPDFKICERKSADGKEWNFKISSWNVAGLRSCAGKGFSDYVKHEDPDIFCMQETKCPDEKLPPEVKIAGYSKHFLAGSKPGYAGVALYSKVKPIEVRFGLGSKEFDDEGRVITAEFEKFFLVNTYVVNAGQGLKNLSKRMKWDELFRNHLKELDTKKPVILTGDLNVAHNPIDLANPKTNTKSAGFTVEERDGFTELLKNGFVDTFRDLYPDREGCYSYWTYLGNARSRNVGWRLDYFVLSERFKSAVCDNVMRTEIYGSDHCPITLFMRLD